MDFWERDLVYWMQAVHLVSITNSTPTTLEQTVQTLVDNAGSKAEVTKLQIEVTKLKKQLKDESSRRVAAEDEQKDVLARESKQNELTTNLEKYNRRSEIG